MKLNQIEKIREPGYQNRLEKLIRDEQEYLVSLKELIREYGTFLKDKFPSNVLINGFFVNIAEIQEQHDKMLRKIHNNKRMGGRKLGTIFEEVFLGPNIGLLKIYKNYFAKLNSALRVIQTRLEKSVEFFYHLLTKSSGMKYTETHVGMMVIPATRLQQLLTDLDDMVYYTRGINEMETTKLKRVRKSIAQILSAGINPKQTSAPAVTKTKVAETVPAKTRQRPLTKRRSSEHRPPELSAKRRSLGTTTKPSLPRLVRDPEPKSKMTVKRATDVLRNTTRQDLLKLTSFPLPMPKTTTTRKRALSPKRR